MPFPEHVMPRTARGRADVGDFSMTCSASGLSIGGGTPVRCLLLTKSPYGDDGRGGGWRLRTPPLRAEYNSYGSIENVHVDDRPITRLWLRGLWEDLVELDQGGNSAHDVPIARDMTFEELLGAIRSGRILVRQDLKTFWRGSAPCDQDKTEDKRLAVSMAMIREDVWQALIAYPHEDLVSLPCTTCGQIPWYHESGRVCPTKKTNEHDENHYKEHAPDTTYTHGPVFDEGIEHRIVATEWAESVWYGISAYRAGIRRGWAAIVRHFDERDAPEAETNLLLAQEDQKFLDMIQSAIDKERERIAALPEVERLGIEAKGKVEMEAFEAEQERKRIHPRFSDFPLRYVNIDRNGAIGCWIMQESAPGVIGIPEHLSMILADRSDPGEVILDAIAELAAVRRVLDMVGVPIRPATASGPQYAKWPEFVRFHRTLLAISEAEAARTRDGVSVAPSTLAEMELLAGVK